MKSGFTLIETLVVIAIIGLLSSITIASLKHARNEATNSRKISTAREYIRALELFYGNNGYYPKRSANLYHPRCLGINQPDTCFDGGNGAFVDDDLNQDLAPYIPGPPAMTDSIPVETGNLRGIGYECLEYTTDGSNCNVYALFWAMTNTSQQCGAGFVDNLVNPIDLGGAYEFPDNTVCVYTNNPAVYGSLY